MKIEQLKKRLNKNRKMTAITLRMPEDIIGDLKQLAPILGFSGYQPLLRAYVGQGLRKDLEKFQNDNILQFINKLKQQGVSKQIINTALSDLAKAS